MPIQAVSKTTTTLHQTATASKPTQPLKRWASKATPRCTESCAASDVNSTHCTRQLQLLKQTQAQNKIICSFRSQCLQEQHKSSSLATDAAGTLPASSRSSFRQQGFRSQLRAWHCTSGSFQSQHHAQRPSSALSDRAPRSPRAPRSSKGLRAHRPSSALIERAPRSSTELRAPTKLSAHGPSIPLYRHRDQKHIRVISAIHSTTGMPDLWHLRASQVLAMASPGTRMLSIAFGDGPSSALICQAPSSALLGRATDQRYL